MTIPIHVDKTVVGYVEGRYFKKTLNRRRGHFLKIPPAIAFSKDSLRQAEAARATHVLIYEESARVYYSAPISLIWSKGFSIGRAGYEPQIALALHHFTRSDTAEQQLGMF